MNKNKSVRMVIKKSSICMMIFFAGCSNSNIKSKNIPVLDVIGPATSVFCEDNSDIETKGGMYRLNSKKIQNIGLCEHRFIKEKDTIILYISKSSEINLRDDLDFYINPNDFYVDDIDEDKKNIEDCQSSGSCSTEPLKQNSKAKEIVLRFDSNSTEPNNIGYLDDELLDPIHKNNITVIGHSDSVGSDQYNLNLSLKRANRVKQILISKGIHEKMIKVVGMGEGSPITDNETIQGRDLNRRAVIKGE
jgi:outer membrane protein OmpA-like peptidoglycan-associated protein